MKNEKLSKSFIVICYQRLGDVLLTTPLIRSIRNKFPLAIIDVMVMLGTESVIIGNIDINNILIWDKKLKPIRKLGQLATIFNGYDVAIASTPNDRAVLHAWLSGRFKIGFTLNKKFDWIKKILLNKTVTLNTQSLHTIQKINQLGNLIGIDCDTNIRSPKIKSDQSNLTKKIISFLDSNKRKAILHPIPKFNYKQWHFDSWVDLCKELVKNDFQIGFSGSAQTGEINYINRIIKNANIEEFNFTNKDSFAEISYIIKNSDVFIGVDTVTSHLAAGVGIPTIVLFGPTNPIWWGPMPYGYLGKVSPWSERFNNGIAQKGNVVILQSEMKCVPCHLEGCDLHLNSFSKCLYDINVKRLMNEIKNLT